jgi:hypothetical protein
MKIYATLLVTICCSNADWLPANLNTCQINEKGESQVCLYTVNNLKVDSSVYSYSDQGNLLSIVKYRPKGLQNNVFAWDTLDVTYFYNNSAGQKDSSSYFFKETNISERNRSFYFYSGHILDSTIEYSKNNAGMFEKTGLFTYKYSGNGKLEWTKYYENIQNNWVATWSQQFKYTAQRKIDSILYFSYNNSSMTPYLRVSRQFNSDGKISIEISEQFEINGWIPSLRSRYSYNDYLLVIAGDIWEESTPIKSKSNFRRKIICKSPFLNKTFRINGKRNSTPILLGAPVTIQK